MCDDYTDMLQKAVFSKFYTLVHKDRPEYIEEIVHLSGKDSVETVSYTHLFLRELCENHISGQLRVAPEHISDKVLSRMGKPSRAVYDSFIRCV